MSWRRRAGMGVGGGWERGGGVGSLLCEWTFRHSNADHVGYI